MLYKWPHWLRHPLAFGHSSCFVSIIFSNWVKLSICPVTACPCFQTVGLEYTMGECVLEMEWNLWCSALWNVYKSRYRGWFCREMCLQLFFCISTSWVACHRDIPGKWGHNLAEEQMFLWTLVLCSQNKSLKYEVPVCFVCLFHPIYTGIPSSFCCEKSHIVPNFYKNDLARLRNFHLNSCFARW